MARKSYSLYTNTYNMNLVQTSDICQNKALRKFFYDYYLNILVTDLKQWITWSNILHNKSGFQNRDTSAMTIGVNWWFIMIITHSQYIVILTGKCFKSVHFNPQGPEKITDSHCVDLVERSYHSTHSTAVSVTTWKCWGKPRPAIAKSDSNLNSDKDSSGQQYIRRWVSKSSAERRIVRLSGQSVHLHISMEKSLHTCKRLIVMIVWRTVSVPRFDY